jgi:hypothetical protein
LITAPTFVVTRLVSQTTIDPPPQIPAAKYQM